MPEQTAPRIEPTGMEPETTPSRRRPPILSKLWVALALGGVVLVECTIAYLYLPTPSETAAMVGADPAAADPGFDPSYSLDRPREEDLEEQTEVDLGEFSVTAFQPISSTTLRIDFHLYGTVDPEEKADFDEAWKESTHRVRDQVIVTVRSCQLTELTDAGLGLIKRRILEKSNRILGSPFLKSIIFSDFSFIEQ
jgi:hypothetical protein